MSSDIGAEPTVGELGPLPGHGWRLLLCVAATVRLAPFLSAASELYDVARARKVLDQLVVLVEDPSQLGVGAVPMGAEGLPEVDPESWPYSAGPVWMASDLLAAVGHTLRFAASGDVVHVQFAMGTVLNAMESWAEYDLARRGVTFDQADPASWDVEKYSFAPLLMELGAQRLDLVTAMRGEVNGSRSIIERAETLGQRSRAFYDEWAGNESQWRTV